jgi:hypothetical protein
MYRVYLIAYDIASSRNPNKCRAVRKHHGNVLDEIVRSLMAEMMKEEGEKLGKLRGGGGLVMMIRMANVQERYLSFRDLV